MPRDAKQSARGIQQRSSQPVRSPGRCPSFNTLKGQVPDGSHSAGGGQHLQSLECWHHRLQSLKQPAKHEGGSPGILETLLKEFLVNSAKNAQGRRCSSILRWSAGQLFPVPSQVTNLLQLASKSLFTSLRTESQDCPQSHRAHLQAPGCFLAASGPCRAPPQSWPMTVDISDVCNS